MAARIYEKLITQDKVDAVLGPYSSPVTDAVADVTEQHRMAMVAPGAATTSIFRKGRKFIFMLPSRAEIYLEGLIDMAARRGLKTVALTHEDTLATKAMAQGAIELAKKRGLSVVLVEAYPKGTTDFSAILTKVRAANPDVLAAATYFDDAVAMTRQLKELEREPEDVWRDGGRGPAEVLRGARAERGVRLRRDAVGAGADGVAGRWLVPLARQYPGAREFVESHRKEFPGADLSVSLGRWLRRVPGAGGGDQARGLSGR